MSFFSEFRQFMVDVKDFMAMLRSEQPINFNVNVQLTVNGTVVDVSGEVRTVEGV